AATADPRLGRARGDRDLRAQSGRRSPGRTLVGRLAARRLQPRCDQGGTGIAARYRRPATAAPHRHADACAAPPRRPRGAHRGRSTSGRRHTWSAPGRARWRRSLALGRRPALRPGGDTRLRAPPGWSTTGRLVPCPTRQYGRLPDDATEADKLTAIGSHRLPSSPALRARQTSAGRDPGRPALRFATAPHVPGPGSRARVVAPALGLTSDKQ